MMKSVINFPELTSSCSSQPETQRSNMKQSNQTSEQAAFRELSGLGCPLLLLNRPSGRCGRKTHRRESRRGACLRPPAALRSRVAMVEPLAPFQTETIRLDAFDCNLANALAPSPCPPSHSQPRLTLTPDRLQFR